MNPVTLPPPRFENTKDRYQISADQDVKIGLLSDRRYERQIGI